MNNSQPLLVRTNQNLLSLQNEFLSFSDELGKDSTFLGNIDLLREDFKKYLRILENHSNGRDLPKGWVPHIKFWYISGNQTLIGSADLRYALTPDLEDLGGHIGYIIRPGYRNKGHATRLLALVLKEAMCLQLKKVLLTTDVENIASRTVIEKNGGRLEAISFSRIARKMKARYWIYLN